MSKRRGKRDAEEKRKIGLGLGLGWNLESHIGLAIDFWIYFSTVLLIWFRLAGMRNSRNTIQYDERKHEPFPKVSGVGCLVAEC
jgi:hypothetical protein